eukprot:TRINITY_DN19247_c0_g1_i1.p1 TRINITY_DN19247_c0_g1~~TRINITY_DN19247_c0_g1_i1.p1  ORF type:complete len:521 (+),score=199.58 TRINITY_DN19247_c0_g1_i1:37-1563(+)
MAAKRAADGKTKRKAKGKGKARTSKNQLPRDKVQKVMQLLQRHAEALRDGEAVPEYAETLITAVQQWRDRLEKNWTVMKAKAGGKPTVFQWDNTEGEGTLKATWDEACTHANLFYQNAEDDETLPSDTTQAMVWDAFLNYSYDEVGSMTNGLVHKAKLWTKYEDWVKNKAYRRDKLAAKNKPILTKGLMTDYPWGDASGDDSDSSSDSSAAPQPKRAKRQPAATPSPPPPAPAPPRIAPREHPYNSEARLNQRMRLYGVLRQLGDAATADPFDPLAIPAEVVRALPDTPPGQFGPADFQPAADLPPPPPPPPGNEQSAAVRIEAAQWAHGASSDPPASAAAYLASLGSGGAAEANYTLPSAEAMAAHAGHDKLAWEERMDCAPTEWAEEDLPEGHPFRPFVRKGGQRVQGEEGKKLAAMKRAVEVPEANAYLVACHMEELCFETHGMAAGGPYYRVLEQVTKAARAAPSFRQQLLRHLTSPEDLVKLRPEEIAGKYLAPAASAAPSPR